MPSQCVVAVYDSFPLASSAIHALENSEFPADQVSLVTHDVEKEVPRTEPMQYGDDTHRDAAKGAGVGGLLGLLLGAPLLAIPGIGPMLIAGPLAVGMTGAIVGGFLGSMVGWGVHADHVAEYEKKVREGALLVVASGDPDDVALAQRVLQATDARSVDLHAKTSADEVSP